MRVVRVILTCLSLSKLAELGGAVRAKHGESVADVQSMGERAHDAAANLLPKLTAAAADHGLAASSKETGQPAGGRIVLHRKPHGSTAFWFSCISGTLVCLLAALSALAWCCDGDPAKAPPALFSAVDAKLASLTEKEEKEVRLGASLSH
eukprot:TRINITY_DN23060_c0_g2_i1.p1 TRINITY_DN23060_c0_g2~~TRINITY_DN23060_c0_g2_i1.p1  ORF type:complete len:150 (+),score=30.12 TRINITY_DN23060_c0_g2_i1:115-564(+)